MTKVIWLSDLHFQAKGNVLGLDPRVRLQTCVDFINTHHEDADFCVISGDMVNRGTELDYARVTDYLSQLAIPYFPMVGNHDKREMFRAHLPVPDQAMASFVQYKIQVGETVFLCLDTLDEGNDSGAFCSERLNWLEEQCAQAQGANVYLFMHHPPKALGLPMQDQDRNLDGEGLMAVVRRFTCVKHMFIGHVHRPMTGTFDGVPFATMRSVLYQAPAPKPDWNWDSFAPANEEPNIGVLTLKTGDSRLEFIQFA